MAGAADRGVARDRARRGARFPAGRRRAPRRAPKPSEAAFRKFVADLWPLAEARGVSRPTFDTAFRGVTFDPEIVAHTKNQAEFVRPIWQYLASAVSSARIERGRAKAEEERAWLDKAEADLWRRPIGRHGHLGHGDRIRRLRGFGQRHPRAREPRLRPLWRRLFSRRTDRRPRHSRRKATSGAREMRGSWAGAMGQTQFMPSSFLDYAVDFEGHGRRDIWNSAPDAIGSTANYLARHGWIAGAPWGFEVRLPDGFKLTDADSSRLAPFASFAERGVARADGDALPRSGEAQLLIPAGLDGPIFLVTANFKTIKSYNNSTVLRARRRLARRRDHGTAAASARAGRFSILS